MLHYVDDITFRSEVIGHPGPVLVEFFTQSCGPCRQLEPHLKRLADKLQGRIKVVKVDSERSPNVAAHYDVRMAPTLVIFRGGQPMATIQGAPPPSRLASFVQSFL